MPKNYDFDVSKTKEFLDRAVLESNFPFLPIFWGPNQLETNFAGYRAPDNEKWRHREQLNIPQVLRFLHNGDTEYDTETFNDGDGGSGTITYEWRVVGYSYNLTPPGIIFIVWRNVTPGHSGETACPTKLIYSNINIQIVVAQFPVGKVCHHPSPVFPCVPCNGTLNDGPIVPP